MGLTISIVRQTFIGDMKRVIADIAFDVSYPTGGESMKPADLGMYAFDLVNTPPKSGYLLEYDYTNEKLKVFTPVNAQAAHQHIQKIATGATAAADSTSGALVKDSAGAETVVRAMGTAVGTTYDIGKCDADGAISAAPASEVADTTNLSGLTGVRIVADGC